MRRHIAFPTASVSPLVARAWAKSAGVVVSFTRPDSEERVAIVPPGRLQAVLDRAHAEFGEPGKVLEFPERLTR